MATSGVAEFKRLGLIELLQDNGAIHVERNVPYDEDSEQALPTGRGLKKGYVDAQKNFQVM
ncbi:hypothetical protein AC629_23620 [Bradyrhizobium sp. NAS80.1]|uniref:hypothetical protein n=1 Tax=Bradyrhizobium sp. NAS80.1 TaxID=1680159 RepID=UPI00095DDDA1|nr:hypothetical protein [Bradyrhizobium sp. NAS80.1]OKO82618.1 hypothetical protein AC629_23620 [Bradyrhizobium sp. NAS80.1]